MAAWCEGMWHLRAAPHPSSLAGAREGPSCLGIGWGGGDTVEGLVMWRHVVAGPRTRLGLWGPITALPAERVWGRSPMRTLPPLGTLALVLALHEQLRRCAWLASLLGGELAPTLHVHEWHGAAVARDSCQVSLHHCTDCIRWFRGHTFGLLVEA